MVTIAFTSGAERKVGRLARDFPRPALLRAVTLERSEAELMELLDRIREQRELARQGKLALPGIPERFDTADDIKRNAVLVTVDNRTEEVVQAFRDRYGEAVIVEEGPRIEPAVESDSR